MNLARSTALPFVVLGFACIVAGGLVSAVTGLAPSEHGSWAAAYLVLVAGVAQVGLGAAQAALAPRAPSGRVLAAELALWNVGNVAVMAGTLAGLVWLVDVGGALLVAGLATFAYGVRGTGGRGGWLLSGFRLLVVVLLVSIPVGLWLARG